MSCGVLFLVFSGSASASTLNGVATIASSTDSTPLTSGGSTTQFTVTLPPNAACSGDTASDSYHVYSYMVQPTVSLSTVTFTNSPSAGYGLLDASGTYFGPANTAITTGQIIDIPSDFEWEPLAASVGVPALLYTGGTSGVWDVGIACANTSGTLTDNWNTEVTFTASTTDPNKFVWSDSDASANTTPPASSTTTTTAAGSTATTTAAGGATTTTTANPSSAGTGGTSGASGDPGSTGSSGSTGSGSTGALAFTGMPASAIKMVGVGLLGIGFGLMLLGAGDRRRVPRAMRRAAQ
jgi:hypothetical protein